MPRIQRIGTISDTTLNVQSGGLIFACSQRQMIEANANDDAAFSVFHLLAIERMQTQAIAVRAIADEDPSWHDG